MPTNDSSSDQFCPSCTGTHVPAAPLTASTRPASAVTQPGVPKSWVPRGLDVTMALGMLGNGKFGHILRDAWSELRGDEADRLASVISHTLSAVALAELGRLPAPAAMREYGTTALVAAALAPPRAPVRRPTPPPQPPREGDKFMLAYLSNVEHMVSRGDIVATASAARQVLEYAERAEDAYISQGLDAVEAELGRDATTAAAAPTSPPATLDLTGVAPELAGALAAVVSAVRAGELDRASRSARDLHRALALARSTARQFRDLRGRADAAGQAKPARP